ncbi:group III truncated hemoglobin [Ponticaulis sp.]|uniref:group III truncated hemoglobin n=1 Tax=Ponticaulis sp. TaxID=2020902 RepID=UPI00262712D9|nr:group III truncated hemoglobin [Ponticaulis sp.]MDF1679224.1 group III truncated hemoglobin [Ponticaulis sp.]
MTEKRQRSAEQRIAEKQAEAAAMGVDEAYISDLIDEFYTRVRANETLGPIFEGAIGDHWAPHLSTMKDFWSSMVLSTGRYQGRPMPKHMALKDIQPEHFETWLELFYQTLTDTAPTQEAEDWFIDRAVRIGKSFQLALFYRPDMRGGVVDA